MFMIVYFCSAPLFKFSEELLTNTNSFLSQIPQVTTKHQQYMEKFGHQAVQTVNEVSTNTNNNGSNLKSTSAAKNYLSPSTGATPNVSFSPHLVTTSSPSPATQNPIRKAVASEPSAYMRKGSPREKLIEDLTHTDLSTILTTDTIDRRNRMLAEVGSNDVFSPYPASKIAASKKIAKTISTNPSTKFIPTNERGTLLLDVYLPLLVFRFEFEFNSTLIFFFNPILLPDFVLCCFELPQTL